MFRWTMLLRLGYVMLAILPLQAQWVHYPTPGVPKLRDGSPNYAAPAPKTAEGKPDLSGMWAPSRQGVENLNEGLDGQTNVRSPFWDLNFRVEGGLPYQPWAKALRDQRAVDFGKDNPDVQCFPLGILQTNTHVFPRRLMQSPTFIALLFERNFEFRQIFLDGRPLPEDPNPAWNGYSTGHWEGDELVVESIGFRDGLWADYFGSPLTDTARITERFRRVNYGTMDLEITVNDSKAYTRPWTLKLAWQLIVNSDLLEYTCIENEKDTKHMVGK